MKQITNTVPPISTMKDSLSAVFKYCGQVADHEINCLADMGIGSYTQLAEAATLAHWISTKPELMMKADLEIYFPIQMDVGPDAAEVVLKCTEMAMPAVAWLLGRDQKRTKIHVVQLRSLDVKQIEGCKNGVWREEGSTPGTQCGDAVWLGYVDPKQILEHYFLSEDLAHVVHCGVPVGLGVLDETAKAISRDILMFGGYILSPDVKKQKLSDESALWEKYRHSKDCSLIDTYSYTINIVGATAPEDDLKVIKHNIETSKRFVQGHIEDRNNAIILQESLDGITAMIGNIIKCAEDIDPDERYQILTEHHMVRLSDGAVMLIGLTDDLRGPEQFEIDRRLLMTYPGIETDWIGRIDWGDVIVEKYKTEFETPMMTRKSRLNVIKSMAELKKDMSPEEGGQLEAVWHTSLPVNHPVSGAARIFFGMLDKRQVLQAKGVLLENPDIISAVNSDGDSPLMRSVECGDIELLKTCLELKADVNFRGDDGFAPLHIAARKGFTTICEKLLDSGADIDAVTPLGWTAVMQAIQFEHKGCVKMLVRRGADTKKNHGPFSAAAMAKSKGIPLK